MPRARYTAEGGTYRVAGISFEPGDEREVDRELATHLSDNDDFEVIVEKDAADGSTEEDETDSTDDVDEDADAFDAAAFVDRTPYGDVVDDIEAGEADDHLDAVAEAADRVAVEDAVGERRAELEA